MTGRIPGIILILAAVPLLTGALWMDDQPSFKTYKAPLPATPEGSVPVTGREPRETHPPKGNPQVTAATLAEGKRLFLVNCAMCHGADATQPGPVGRKLTPPPPRLEHAMVQELSDATILQAMGDGFGRMPSFRRKLTPAERWTVLQYLRTRQ